MIKSQSFGFVILNLTSITVAPPAPNELSINSGNVNNASGKSSEYGTPSFADARQRPWKSFRDTVIAIRCLQFAVFYSDAIYIFVNWHFNFFNNKK
jgi:hypothetical protein